MVVEADERLNDHVAKNQTHRYVSNLSASTGGNRAARRAGYVDVMTPITISVRSDRNPARQDKIIRMRLAADISKSERPKYQVMKTDSQTFAQLKDEKRNITNPFFFRKPVAILDVCNMAAPVRRAP